MKSNVNLLFLAGLLAITPSAMAGTVDTQAASKAGTLSRSLYPRASEITAPYGTGEAGAMKIRGTLLDGKVARTDKEKALYALTFYATQAAPVLLEFAEAVKKDRTWDVTLVAQMGHVPDRRFVPLLLKMTGNGFTEDVRKRAGDGLYAALSNFQGFYHTDRGRGEHQIAGSISALICGGINSLGEPCGNKERNLVRHWEARNASASNR